MNTPTTVLLAGTLSLLPVATLSMTTPGQVDPTFHARFFPMGSPAVLKDLAFLPDGRVLVLGVFAVSNGGPGVRLTRLLADGSVDPTFHPEASNLLTIEGSDVQADGKIVLCGRNPQAQVIRRLLPDGQIDPAFGDVSAPDSMGVKVAPDGGLPVTGLRGIMRLLPDGRRDEAFNRNAAVDNHVFSISLTPSGILYLGGNFYRVGQQIMPMVARLFPDGSPDPAFAAEHSFATFPGVGALTDGVLAFDSLGIHRLDLTGHFLPYQGERTLLGTADLTGFDGIVGTYAAAIDGSGVQLGPDGSPTAVEGRFDLPPRRGGYRFLKQAPDGALWLAVAPEENTPDAVDELFRLTGLDPYNSWMNQYGLVAAEAAPDADPDHDGIANLSEFAYGSSPRDPLDRPRFKLSLGQMNGAVVPSVEFHRRRNLGSITFSAATSTSPSFTEPSPAEIVSVTPEDNAFEKVVIRAASLPGSKESQFFRLVLRREP